MVFRGGTEAVSVVANKGGGRGAIENWLPMRGEGGERNQKNGTVSDGIS